MIGNLLPFKYQYRCLPNSYARLFVITDSVKKKKIRAQVKGFNPCLNMQALKEGIISYEKR